MFRFIISGGVYAWQERSQRMLILCYNRDNITIVIAHKQRKTDKSHIVVQKIVQGYFISLLLSTKPKAKYCLCSESLTYLIIRCSIGLHCPKTHKRGEQRGHSQYEQMYGVRHSTCTHTSLLVYPVYEKIRPDRSDVE